MSRKYIRFPPGSDAKVFYGESPEGLHDSAKIVNESYSGVCVSVQGKKLKYKARDILFVKVGPIATMQARIMWIRMGGPEEILMGLDYIE